MSRAAHFTFPRMPTADQTTVVQQVLTGLEAHGLGATPAADQARRVLRAAALLHEQEAAWSLHRRGGASKAVASAPRGGPELNVLDTAVDNLLGRLYRKLEADIIFFERGSAEGAPLERLLDALFPHGLVDHVRLRWMAQVAANRRLVEVLTGPTYAAEVAAAGLRPLIAPLTAAVDRFEEGFRSTLTPGSTAPTWADLLEGSAEAHEGLLLLYMHLELLVDASPLLYGDVLAPLLTAWEASRTRRRRSTSEASAEAESDEG
ncbi:MAG: hypothetical protein JNM72_07885 [Deltaproteobacteria bacterium]|nr:hypothetical protein [Deltaproteobacteria bacterium]